VCEQLCYLGNATTTRQTTRSYRGFDFALSDRIIGACIEVHRTLGPGFQQIIYQRALELELPPQVSNLLER
jgi:PD-(D/E)XK nuclease superfamily